MLHVWNVKSLIIENVNQTSRVISETPMQRALAFDFAVADSLHDPLKVLKIGEVFLVERDGEVGAIVSQDIKAIGIEVNGSGLVIALLGLKSTSKG